MIRTAMMFLASVLPLWPAMLCSEEVDDPRLQQFYRDMRMVVLKHYPKASTSQLDGNFHAEHDTRLFMIHHPTLLGDWQDASEERGPKRGGMMCQLQVKAGPYGGMAALPQTFDHRYFKVLRLAPYSSQRDQHLSVRLAYPADAKPEFLTDFTKAVNNFSDLAK